MRDRLVFLGVLLLSAVFGVLFVMLRPPTSPDDEDNAGGVDSSAPALSVPGLDVPSGDAAAEAGDAGVSDTGAPVAELPAELPGYVRIHPDGASACAQGMVLVDGIYCPFVAHRCLRYAPSPARGGDAPEGPCLEFQPDVLCEGRLQHRTFCVDVLEYPNLEGTVPVTMVSFEDAKRACALEGKRLCTVEEWEFACEGTQMWPYPHGFLRDASVCNIDRSVGAADASLLRDPRRASEFMSAVDARVPSGSMPKCVSPFGVRDMTGNVDEWVENTAAALEGHPQEAVKGGSFFPGRSLCRPTAVSPGVPPQSLGAGFRCCADAKGSARSVRAMPPKMKMPKKQ